MRAFLISILFFLNIIIKNSIESGKHQENTFKNRYKNYKLKEIIEKMGIRLVESRSENSFNIIHFGQYEEVRIIIYKETTNKVQTRSKILRYLLGLKRIYDIILTYKIFHK